MDDPGWGSDLPRDGMDLPVPPGTSGGRSGSPPPGKSIHVPINARTVVGTSVVVAFIILVVVFALVFKPSEKKVDQHTDTTTTKVTTSTTAPPSTTTTMSIADASKQYLAIEQPVDNAIVALQQKATTWGPNITGAQALSDSQPTITALQAASVQLTQSTWPPSATADAKALSAQIGIVAGDLQDVGRVKASTLAQWQSALNHDNAILTTDVDAMRHDLGLPASPLG